MGGGLPSTEVQRWIQLGPAFFGLVGETDFNYYDMQKLASQLDIEGIPNRLVPFPGGHQWPPAELCAEALDWMQLQAMRNGLLQAENGFLEGYLQRELSRSRIAEGEGRSADAYQTLLDLTQDLAGLIDLFKVRGDLERLISSKAVRAQLKKREREARKADQSVQLGFRVLDRIRHARRDDLPPLRDLVFEMRIRPLRKKAEGKDVEERLAAQRVLESLFVQLSFYLPRDFKQAEDYAGAQLSLQLAAEIKPESPLLWYRLAQVESLSGSTQSALKSLQKALDYGFPRPELFATDPELEAVRKLPGFESVARPSRP